MSVSDAATLGVACLAVAVVVGVVLGLLLAHRDGKAGKR